ncbi:universal stress protein [Robiginitalea sp. SC105]|uniref:universal stress protein n=1 Tax=Robiginitalea sp. SC105 TaxID=2762332 RepID=UPI001639E543|nr:universal stress protein [Robiginitalea sp. SC105]MBC2839558.1 universal stress protein [Robiginitalea sp. SC105]
MKTILLPVDFSENSWNAVFSTLKLFDKTACHFILLHAYSMSPGKLPGDPEQQKLWQVLENRKREATDEMEQMLGYLEREHRHPKHRISGTCVPGELISCIQAVLEAEPVDLIAIGTQGATGAEQLFMGSNAVRIMRRVRTRPTLIVPAGFDFQRLRHVLFPTDYLHAFEPYQLKLLKELVLQWRATLHIVYVASEFELKPSQQDHRELLESRLPGINCRFEEVPIKGHLKDALLGHAHKIGAEMIALVRHRHSLLEAVVKEPVVKRLAFETTMPLLVLPELS